MPVLHDASGERRWITVLEEGGNRYLYLDGCEEGAMALASEEPVFNYLWFHKAAALAARPSRRILVLGAGAFTAPKCLALDYPDAAVDVVDIEPALHSLARRVFRLDQPAFARIAFHGVSAEDFLRAGHFPYDFIFDDLFDGYQHVPEGERGPEHMERLRAALAPGGLCLKNIIWDPRSSGTRETCVTTTAAWQATFPWRTAVALGDPARGHNRMLLGRTEGGALEWREVHKCLARAGVPALLLAHCRVLG